MEHRAWLAQSVERWTFNPTVAGSSPASGLTFIFLFQNQAPYHNNVHACDVLSTLHRLLEGTQLVHWFSDLELFSMLFAAAIHDLEHTGKYSKYISHFMSHLSHLARFAEIDDSPKALIHRRR